MNISQFINTIRHARKQTGVVLAADEFSSAVNIFKQGGFSFVDAADQYTGKIFLTADQLVNKLMLLINDKPVLLVNLELFIAPRLSDGRFVEELARKLVVSEPKQPIVLLFYSATIYKTFSTIYQLTLQTQRHTLDLTEDGPLHEA